LAGLAPGRANFFRISSGVGGLVFEAGDVVPIPETMDWAELNHGGIDSSPLATRADAAGTWRRNLGNFKASSTGAVPPCSAGDRLVVHFVHPGFKFGLTRPGPVSLAIDDVSGPLPKAARTTPS
jgi:hypothetical protein